MDRSIVQKLRYIGAMPLVYAHSRVFSRGHIDKIHSLFFLFYPR
jgi:hypothetical protein